jgi:O-acetyl-ADP-ribose deacetylase (regulator of RNase III)
MVALASTNTYLSGRVVVLQGDITRQEVDCIVNAANHTLLGGGGVDGAIHEAGGPEILAACEELRRSQFPQGLPVGHAVLTTAGQLPARGIIHTVGPVKVVHGDQDADLLSSCYRNCLSLAVQHEFHTIAFPAISTGIYGYPREEVARVSSSAICRFLDTNVTIKEVRLVFFTNYDFSMFLKHHVFRN